MIRDGIKTLVSLGVCPESEWSYDTNTFTEKPSITTYADALKYKITAYYRLTILDTLASGFPFVFGFSVYESFESDQVALISIVPLPAENEQLLGGHAVMAVGYDNSKQQFIVRNSWGTSWGQKGYFFMPYAYLTNANLSSDFWTIRDME